MREGYSKQRRLDTHPIGQIPLNHECRDEIVPILAALQHVYSQPQLRDEILERIASDVNGASQSDCGRPGITYWQIIVLAAVRLGCNFNYDRMQDLAENHRRLRAIMGIGDWEDDFSFSWQRIRDNVCLLSPETIHAINRMIVEAGHILAPEAVETVRADSFVMETRVHYPTESSIIRDGIEKIIGICQPLAEVRDIPGWRQHEHLWKQVRRSARTIDRIGAKKGPNYRKRLRVAYATLLKQSRRIVERARELSEQLGLPPATPDDVFGDDGLPAYIARTERVMDTARRRVLEEESVPNSDKLFSLFEPHTQLYKRGKAAQPVQFGRQVLVYEDSAGFLIHGYVMPRDVSDKEVVVGQTKFVQQSFDNKIRRASFDRGFHSPENQKQLSALVPSVCLPKPGKKQAARQLAAASDDFHEGVQSHPGVESAIGALQSGNGLKRCRDRTEPGFERYVALGILGRNLHTLGRLLIAQQSPDSEAAYTRRAA